MRELYFETLRYKCVVKDNGDIMAYSKSPQTRRDVNNLNASDLIHDIPYTDRDLIIAKARRTMRKNNWKIF